MEKETELATLTTVTDPNQSSESTALVAIDTKGLSVEARRLLNELIVETDNEKTKDLTYLFNVNQAKKTMVRIDTLGELEDKLIALLHKRVVERPDEMTTQETLTAIKTIQDAIERSNKVVSGGDDKPPLIQINQQDNSVNVDGTSTTRDSRQRVQNVINDVLKELMPEDSKTVVDAKVEEAKLVEDENDD